jgi:predicted DNA-binding transcriptional regulator AlpA
MTGRLEVIVPYVIFAMVALAWIWMHVSHLAERRGQKNLDAELKKAKLRANELDAERESHRQTRLELFAANHVCETRLAHINRLQIELDELRNRQEDRLLNVHGVSDLVSLSAHAIHRRVNKGEFPPPVVRRGPGMELWSELVVRKWIEGLKTAQTAADGGGKDD